MNTEKQNNALSSNGRTPGSEPVNLGSNPNRAALKWKVVAFCDNCHWIFDFQPGDRTPKKCPNCEVQFE